jgi:hypothetical protein
MNDVKTGETLQDHATRITDVYFPNGSVFSVTMSMPNGALAEVATVGARGHAWDRHFLRRSHRGRSDISTGRRWSIAVDGGAAVQQGMASPDHSAQPSDYIRTANVRHIMQCAACNALHDVTQRCCRWLLQTHDRVDSDDFPMRQEFLAIMLGVRRPTVTVVMRSLQEAGLISTRCGRIRILKRRQLENTACECYGVMRVDRARRRV